MVSFNSEYTFKYNTNRGRHGWLRLTPAYSLKLVRELIENVQVDSFILDPFSGTATTGLVAAEEGYDALLYDINPFLIWLGNCKCSNYSNADIENARNKIEHVLADYKNGIHDNNWVPDIYNIERWWTPKTLNMLSAIYSSMDESFGKLDSSKSANLAWIIFCRLIIETSSAAFNHVSMSFLDNADDFTFKHIDDKLKNITSDILNSARIRLQSKAVVKYCDSKTLDTPNDHTLFSHILTSPPYPNRMSYIRELRPYMYWTKFLNGAKEASKIDWDSIGGTWGTATSNLKKWEPDSIELPKNLFAITKAIESANDKNGALMSKYVLKYFHDMYLHLDALKSHLRDNAKLYYIVGNSSFYNIHVPTDDLFKQILKVLNYKKIAVNIVRKRNSKKELFEYCVMAEWNKR